MARQLLRAEVRMTTARTLRLLVLPMLACAGPQRGPPETAKRSETAVVEPRVPPTPSASKPANPRPAKAASKAAKAPTTVLSSVRPAERVQKAESVAEASAKQPATPSLDLKSLELRLKETKAIGFFTKVGIKNQVDDLTDEFRAFYAGRSQTTLAELRLKYDRLILKVLALLQDTDAPLANEIVASREKIWGVLADPSTFATI